LTEVSSNIDVVLNNVNKIYFTGIGGIGMCGLAEYLLIKGYDVSGSDPVQTHITKRLEERGAKINYAQAAENIDKSIDLVVYTSAVKENHPEISAARNLKINCVKRAVLLGEIVNDKYLIAVSGTHGKTTTTGMIAKILIDAELDPTVFVGGNLDFLGSASFRAGNSKFAVVEADEYDRSFLTLKSDIIIINNIELDHTDIYKNETELLESFREFVNNAKKGNLLICSGEYENIRKITQDKNVKYFGMEDENTLAISKISDSFSEFYLNNAKYTAGVTGYHNIYNAAAAVLTAEELQISTEVIKKSLSEFHGVSRRLEKKYEKEIMVYDDYAHHPTEVYFSLKSLKDISKGNLIVIFQPHTYSRVAEFHKEFAESLGTADTVILMPVYAAREKQPDGISSELILSELIKSGQKTIFAENENDLFEKLKGLYTNGDTLVFQGAGDITNYCCNFVKNLNN
jgi:UDP-N-acetylmuramate--alanine ligase